MVELKVYSKKDIEASEIFRRVTLVANELLGELNSPTSLQLIKTANRPGAPSSEIQNTFLPVAKRIGFKDEAKGLFSSYQNKLLRPDYFMRLSETEGILLEVERGKTTINNMDLLDLWKCHICPSANFLFLMVPKELRQNDNMSPRREFNTVAVRMASFFIPGNYTNVDALFLFGY